jgi:hypothetical protein
VGSRRYRGNYRDERRHYVYVEAGTVDRELDESTQSVLQMLPGQPSVSSISFAASVDWEDHTSKMEKFIEHHFDGWLYFHNDGPREVGFRIPRRVLPVETVAPYVADRRAVDGVRMTVDADDLVLRFARYGADEELFNLGETGEDWFGHILPVRDELMLGRLDALELGPMIGTYADDLPGQPDLPAAYGLSKATRILAAYLLVAPAELERWAAGKPAGRVAELADRVAEVAGTRPEDAGLEPSQERAGSEPVAHWEFAAAEPHKSFRIRLDRRPDGSWSVTATDPRSMQLTFDTEQDARRGYHDEAFRLQRLNAPGRWRQLDAG